MKLIKSKDIITKQRDVLPIIPTPAIMTIGNMKLSVKVHFVKDSNKNQKYGTTISVV